MYNKLLTAMRNRYLKIAVEVLLLIVLYLGIKAYMQRDLAAGPAPPLHGQLLSGETVDLQALRNKPVLLHFWATWCKICKLEERSIQAIGKDHTLITVAMESGGPEQVSAYMRDNDLSYPVLVDENGRLARRYGVRGVPASFIIGPGGNILYTEVGYTTPWGLRFRLWLAEP